jgi:hypothetical protein
VSVICGINTHPDAKSVLTSPSTVARGGLGNPSKLSKSSEGTLKLKLNSLHTEMEKLTESRTVKLDRYETLVVSLVAFAVFEKGVGPVATTPLGLYASEP